MKSNSLGIAALMVLAVIVVGIIVVPDPEPQEEPAPSKLHIGFSVPSVELPDVSYAFLVAENRECAKETITKVTEIYERIDSVEVTYERVQMTSLGTYYVTGYTSIECGGSTTTASGTTCHKAASYEDSFENPTTCAIDPKVHDFGDIFFIEGFGYYIAEDTGSAVKQKHLDLYFWDSEYNYALSITGYYEVFSVEYIYGTTQAGAYDVRPFLLKELTDLLVEGEG